MVRKLILKRFLLLSLFLFLVVLVRLFVIGDFPYHKPDDVRENGYYVHFLPRPRVDFRLIVMTFDRVLSLHKCLTHLQDMLFDDPKTTRTMDIWIDRDRKDHVSNSTFAIVKYYKWEKGDTSVNVHKTHGGVFAQWIDTWIPERKYSEHQEVALFVEDDIDVSAYAWRWLRKVRQFYSNRTDIAMYCLQDDNAVMLHRRKGLKVEISTDKTSPVFLYAIPGSWGCSPHEDVWRDFRIWFKEQQELQRKGSRFKPYVKEARLHNRWYKIFVKTKKQNTMWTMWFIYYCRQRQLYGLYSNLPRYMSMKNVSLVVNRKEAGMHYTVRQKVANSEGRLLKFWDDEFTKFPVDIPKYGFKGKRIRSP